MSKGNVIVKTRVEPALLAAIERQIQSRNYHSAREPWDMSDWIRSAMIDKLRKMERSRKHPGGRNRATR